MQVKGYLTHKNIFLFGLVLLAVGIPLSRFLVSVAQLVLLANWLLEGNFRNKWTSLRSSKIFWAFTAIYFFYLAGTLWSTDLSYATKDLRVKLPMLWLPLLFFTTPPLSRKNYHIILHLFVGGVLIASGWSMIIYLGFTPIVIHDIRDISRFESHIRFSLMIVLAILYLFFVAIKKNTRYKPLYFLALIWLLCFLLLLQSLTGLVICGLVAFFSLSWTFVSGKPWSIKIGFTFIILTGTTWLFYLVKDEWKKFYEIKPIVRVEMPLVTKSGRDYYHNYESWTSENGNRVWMYIQKEELQQEWNRKSGIKYDSLDHKGNPIQYTLIRYLASRGLTRDSAGVNQLNDTDIRNIENGEPNCLYAGKQGLRSRIHELIWEIDQARLQQDPTGHSLAMRLEFWKTGWHIIQQHPLMGVGTGDVDTAYKQQYKKDNSPLQERWRLRSHNQFIAVTIALGVCGLLIFLLWLAAPFLSKRNKSVFFVLFLLIQFFSFFNEDTLETQAGVTFCVFFTQFLFHHDEYNS